MPLGLPCIVLHPYPHCQLLLLPAVGWRLNRARRGISDSWKGAENVDTPGGGLHAARAVSVLGIAADSASLQNATPRKVRFAYSSRVGQNKMLTIPSQKNNASAHAIKQCTTLHAAYPNQSTSIASYLQKKKKNTCIACFSSLPSKHRSNVPTSYPIRETPFYLLHYLELRNRLGDPYHRFEVLSLHLHNRERTERMTHDTRVCSVQRRGERQASHSEHLNFHQQVGV